MPPRLCLLLLGLLLIAPGCVHRTPPESYLILPQSDFTQTTGIEQLAVLPSDIPEVRVRIQTPGRYHARLWYRQPSGSKVCVADSGPVEIRAPQTLEIRSDQPPSVRRRDYWLDVEYTAPEGRSVRLEQLVAAWW